MSIGIDIQVNSRQVRDAKQQIDMLNRSLNDTDALGDLNIGENGLPQASQRIREMAEQVRRLQTLSRQGTSKGGILDPRQFQEAAALMRSINASTQEYARNITAVRNEMQQLSRAQADMRRNGQAGTEEFRSNRERIRQLQDERRVLEENERHYRRYGAQGSTAANDISGMNQQQGQGMNLKKALGWTLAAAGGFSILGFLSQSRAKYQQSVGQAAELRARGIQGADGGVGMGYGPLEYQGLLGNLSQTTGVSGDAAQRKAYTTALFARSQGVDLNQAAELHTQTYKATGNNNLSNNMMIGLTKTGLETGKMSELLQQIAKNTQVMSAAQGGAGLNQDMMLMSAYAAVQAMKQGDKEGAVFAKSGEFANFMTNGMQDAGTPAGNLMLFQALGGFDGKFDYAKIHQMNKIKSEGFWNNMDVFDRMMAHAPQLRGEKGSEEYKQSLAERAGWMETHFQGSMKMSPRATELIAEARNKGGILEGYSGNKEDMLKRLNTLIAAGGDEGERAKELKAEIDKNPDVSKLSLEALREKEQIETGKKIHEMLGNIEKGMLETFGKVMDGDFKGAIKALNDAIGPAGIALGIGATALTAGNTALTVSAAALTGSAGALTLAATRLGAKGLVPTPPVPGSPVVAGFTAAGAAAIPAVVAAVSGGAGVYAGRKINESHVKGMSTESIKAMLAGTDSKTVMGGGIGKNERLLLENELKTRPEASSGYKFPTQPYSLDDSSPSNNNIKKYDSWIKKYSEQHGVSESMTKAVIMAESGGKNTAVSPKGAAGLMQLMPGTAKGLGVTNSFDPEQNIFGGTKYLSQMMAKYKGDETSALAAYNWGPGNVDKAKKKHGDKWLHHAPDETKQYVNKVTKNMHKDVSEYTAEVPKIEKAAPDTSKHPYPVHYQKGGAEGLWGNGQFNEMMKVLRDIAYGRNNTQAAPTTK